MSGYYWNYQKQQISVNRSGAKAFCNKDSLLALKSEHIRQDILEREFFQSIDSAGARCVQVLTGAGLEGFTSEQRSDFCRLLLSLDVRRPVNIDRLKAEEATWLRAGLDDDVELVAELKLYNIDGKPSEFYEGTLGRHIEDEVLISMQDLVDNPEVGTYLVNAHWRIRRMPPGSGSLVLSDRPLIRIFKYDNPKAIWMLPLSPACVFVASNSDNVIRRIDSTKPRNIRKIVNHLSIIQAERYVFMIDAENLPLVEKKLIARHK